jgi:hypothetical protein
MFNTTYVSYIARLAQGVASFDSNLENTHHKDRPAENVPIICLEYRRNRDDCRETVHAEKIPCAQH